jgi:hypothetical protein
MTVQLDWPAEVVNRLTEEAERNGLSLDAYLLQTVLHDSARNGVASARESADGKAREDAGRSIRELRKGNILGPELTIRDLVEEGRRV